MSGKDREARFSIKIDGDKAEQSLDRLEGSVEELSSAVKAGQDRIASYNDSLRKLKGSSESVKKARDELKERINKERAAISGAEVALLKSGASSKMVAERKKAIAVQEAKAIEKSRLANAALAASIEGAAIGIAAAVGVAAVAFGAFAIATANAARSQSLLREGVTGSEQNADALGSQVRALAGVLPTAKAEIEALGISMVKGGLQGQTLVDALHATAQVSAAVGEDSGAKIRGILEAGRTTKRIAIDPREGLIGTGMGFDDVASQVARLTKVSIAEARRALAEGRVSVSVGAEAMRAAAEKKFAGLNVRKSLDLEVQIGKMRENLRAMVSGINIEPLLKGISGIMELLSDKTVTGLGVKKLVELLGNGLISALTGSAPIMKAVIQGMVIGFLSVAIAVMKTKKAIIGALGDNQILGNIDGITLAVKGAEYAVYAVAGAMAVLGAASAVAMLPIVLPFGLAAAAIWGVYKAVVWVKDLFVKTDWGYFGEQITKGLAEGIRSGENWFFDSIRSMGEGAKKALKSVFGIASPSKFARKDIAHNLMESARLGVDERTGVVTRSMERAGGAMRGAMELGAGASDGAGAPAVTLSGAKKVELHVHISADAKSGPVIARALTDGGAIASMVAALEDIALTAGIA